MCSIQICVVFLLFLCVFLSIFTSRQTKSLAQHKTPSLVFYMRGEKIILWLDVKCMCACARACVHACLCVKVKLCQLSFFLTELWLHSGFWSQAGFSKHNSHIRFKQLATSFEATVSQYIAGRFYISLRTNCNGSRIVTPGVAEEEHDTEIKHKSCSRLQWLRNVLVIKDSFSDW